MAKDIDGKKIEIGMTVGFKCDIEQYGKVEAIHGDTVTLTNPNGFDGDYIGGDTRTTQDASRCWTEG